jgi:hypothetical protein
LITVSSCARFRRLGQLISTGTSWTAPFASFGLLAQPRKLHVAPLGVVFEATLRPSDRKRGSGRTGLMRTCSTICASTVPQIRRGSLLDLSVFIRLFGLPLVRDRACSCRRPRTAGDRLDITGSSSTPAAVCSDA